MVQLYLRLYRAREEKISEIRKLKEHYNAGYWNANSVLLGGLGQYPNITGTYSLYTHAVLNL